MPFRGDHQSLIRIDHASRYDPRASPNKTDDGIFIDDFTVSPAPLSKSNR
jgi:hypothetical protein